MIILEGPDLVGKTTLANFLSKQLSAPIVHLGAPPKGQRHWDIATTALLDSPLHAIYDRCIIGATIYGPMMGDESPVTPVELETFRRFTGWCRAKVIFCDAPNGLLMERYFARGDDYVSLSQILFAADKYRTVGDDWKYRDEHESVYRYFSDTETPESWWSRYRAPLRRTTLNTLPPDAQCRPLMAQFLGVDPKPHYNPSDATDAKNEPS